MKINKMSNVFKGKNGIPRIHTEEEDDGPFDFDRKTMEIKQKLSPMNVAHSVPVGQGVGMKVIGNILGSSSKKSKVSNLHYFDFKNTKKNPTMMVTSMLGKNNTMVSSYLGQKKTQKKIVNVNNYLGINTHSKMGAKTDKNIANVNNYLGINTHGKTSVKTDKNIANVNNYLGINTHSKMGVKAAKTLGMFEGKMMKGLTMKTDVLGFNRIKQQKGLPMFGDKDKDKLINILDCNPRVKKKQAFWHSLTRGWSGKGYSEQEGDVGPAGTTLPERTSEAIQTGAEYLGEKAGEVKEKAQEIGEAVSEAIVPTPEVSSPDDELMPQPGELMPETQAMEKVVGALETGAETISTGVKEVAGYGELPQPGQSMPEIEAADVISGKISEFGGAVSRITDAPELAQSFKKGVTAGAQVTGKAVTDIGKGALWGIKGAGKLIKGAGTGVVSGVKKGVTGTVGFLEETGLKQRAPYVPSREDVLAQQQKELELEERAIAAEEKRWADMKKLYKDKPEELAKIEREETKRRGELEKKREDVKLKKIETAQKIGIEREKAKAEMFKAEGRTAEARYKALRGGFGGRSRGYSGLGKYGAIPRDIERATSGLYSGAQLAARMGGGAGGQKIAELVGGGTGTGMGWAQMMTEPSTGMGFASMAQPSGGGVGYYSTVATFGKRPEYIIQQPGMSGMPTGLGGLTQGQTGFETMLGIRPTPTVTTETPGAQLGFTAVDEAEEVVRRPLEEAEETIKQEIEKTPRPTVTVEQEEEPKQPTVIIREVPKYIPVPTPVRQPVSIPMQQPQPRYPTYAQEYPTYGGYDGPDTRPPRPGMVWSESSKKWVTYTRGPYRRSRAG